MTMQTLALENSLLRCGIEAARIGMCVSDDHGIILLVTDRFAKALSKDVDGLLGHSQRLLLIGGLQLHNFERVFAVNSPEFASEGEVVEASGTRRNVLFHGHSFSHDGHTYRVVSTVEISDFGVTRDRLIELRRQADAIRAAVVIADARQRELPVVYTTPQLFEVTGYRPTDVIGRSCLFLQGVGTEAEGLAHIRDAIAHQRVCCVVLTNYRKDGSAFRNELTISPLTDHLGHVTHIAIINRALSSRDSISSAQGH
jgi:PAS domain S-box-containing protein